MTLSINITKRMRRRKLASGENVEHLRYVMNWRDPRSGKREQRFFARQKDAVEARSKLLAAYERGSRSTTRTSLTVSDAIAAWLDVKRDVVRSNTFENYKFQSRYVTGPLASAEVRKALIYSGTGTDPRPNEQWSEQSDMALLGHVKVQQLTTRDIRAWHRLISDEVSVYTANKALMILRASLALAAEDHDFRPPAMPTGLRRRSDKPGKVLLTPHQIGVLIEAAKSDLDKGIYYAAPFLMGTRPSEQLGLLWSAINFEANVIQICRSQMMDGTLCEMTKTAAGQRDIPMSPLLREMLLEWRLRCPRKDGKLERVFPNLGVQRTWPQPREGGGGPLLYNNFRSRLWAPALKRLGLPAVTPHSARHAFISTLQAQGIEVGLVAKLAGHKNAVVTLSHYTHAMRGGETAVILLDQAYRVIDQMLD